MGPKASMQTRQERRILSLEYLENDDQEEEEEGEGSEEDVNVFPAPSWLGYGRISIRTIVENLQLEVKDINIRYEDSMTSVGVAVESLTGLDISIDFQVTKFLAQQFFPFPLFYS